MGCDRTRQNSPHSRSVGIDQLQDPSLAVPCKSRFRRFRNRQRRRPVDNTMTMSALAAFSHFSIESSEIGAYVEVSRSASLEAELGLHGQTVATSDRPLDRSDDLSS